MDGQVEELLLGAEWSMPGFDRDGEDIVDFEACGVIDGGEQVAVDAQLAAIDHG